MSSVVGVRSAAYSALPTAPKAPIHQPTGEPLGKEDALKPITKNPNGALQKACM
jgi:hypothetical protein